MALVSHNVRLWTYDLTILLSPMSGVPADYDNVIFFVFFLSTLSDKYL